MMSEKIEPFRIEAVIFDLGGVLVDDMKWEIILEKVDGNDKKATQKQISTSWDEIKVEPNCKESKFWNGVAQVGKLSDVVVRELKEKLKTEIRPNFGTLAVAEQIKVKYPWIQLAVISNHVHFWFDYIIERYWLQSIFRPEFLLSSDSVQCAKPDQKIFSIMFQRLKTANPSLVPEQCLFFDDKEANVEAARKFGFQAYKFNVKKQDISELLQYLQLHGITLFQDSTH
jgi:FMN phosphatase YigB (HAD superfamily)